MQCATEEIAPPFNDVEVYKGVLTHESARKEPGRAWPSLASEEEVRAVRAPVARDSGCHVTLLSASEHGDVYVIALIKPYRELRPFVALKAQIRHTMQQETTKEKPVKKKKIRAWTEAARIVSDFMLGLVG